MLNNDERDAFEVFKDDFPKGGNQSARDFYEYEAHYIKLVSEHREDIEFFLNLLKELEEEQFTMTDRITELDQKLNNKNVDEDVKNVWLKYLAENYSRSVKLSIDLVSHFTLMEEKDFLTEIQKRLRG